MTGRFVLGVDGGNTKTVAAIADSRGRVLAVARGGATDIHAARSPDIALAELARVVSEALAQAGVGADAIDASAFSLAGADWPEDFGLLEREIGARLSLSRPLVVNDALGALRCGAPDWTGVSIACGTYNAIGARNAAGAIFHLGFWPDHTGGADFGSAAIKAVYREGLGLGPQTALTPMVLAAFGATDWRALLHGFTRLDTPVSAKGIKRLAYGVIDAADGGDPVARAILTDAAELLASQARVAAREVGLGTDGLRLVLTGGIFQHPSPLLADDVAQQMPGARLVRATAPAVSGALLLAFDGAGAAVDAEQLGVQLAAASGQFDQ